MTCQNCDNELSDEDVFCGNCGQKITTASEEIKMPVAEIVKVAPPVAANIKANPRSNASIGTKIKTSTTDATKPKTRRRLRAFFLGGAVFTGTLLGGFLVSLAMPHVINGTIFFIGPIALAFAMLVLATALKRVSIGSALLSVGGALFAFLSVAIISASGPEPELEVIAIIFTLIFAAFLIPAFIFRKG